MKAPKLLSEFAARWRRELYPRDVQMGKTVSYYEGLKRKDRSLYREVYNTNTPIDKINNTNIIELEEVDLDKEIKKHKSELKQKAVIARNKLGIDSSKPTTNTIQQRLEAKKSKNNIFNTVSKRANNILKSKKLPLAAVGLATVGAIGTGIALNRKSRNDKGKKRGFYRK